MKPINRDKERAKKKKLLFEYVSKRRQNVKADFSCQWKGGKDERFCRSTSRDTCEGCEFYAIGIWDLYAKAYDIITARDKEIAELYEKLEKLKTERECEVADLKQQIRDMGEFIREMKEAALALN